MLHPETMLRFFLPWFLGAPWYNKINHGKPLIALWLFNIAMENCPFIDGLPSKNGDFPWLC